MKFLHSSDFDLESYQKGDGFVRWEVLGKAVKSMKRLEKRYEKAYDMVQEANAKIGELRATCAGMRNELESQRFHCGRNQIRKKDMSAYDRGNNEVIGNFMKKMFRHHKNLHPSWSLYLPDDPNSFFSKISPELDFPTEFSEEYYWTKTLVPMVNGKMCDQRSDATKSLKQGYLGM